MFLNEQLEDLARKLHSVLPSSLQNIDEELQKQFQDILHFAFLKLDLVTREEFDVQTKVLARTRDKIETIEQELADIIKKIS